MLMRGEWWELQQLEQFQAALVVGRGQSSPKRGSTCLGSGFTPLDGLWHVENQIFVCQNHDF